MREIRDARCLDAFAGSGALGFEAYSRGAAKVVLIEQSPTAFTNLRAIATSFNSPKLQVINGDACDYMRRTDEQFDIIFLDPPFAGNQIPECVSFISQSNILAPDGLLYLESAQEVSLDSNVWETIKLKRAGQVTYGLYRKFSVKKHVSS